MENDKLNKDHLFFSIDGRTFAISVLSSQGVVGNPDITAIMNVPKFVVGHYYMSNYDIPIPVLDLRTIIDRPSLMQSNKNCIIVVGVFFNGRQNLLGFIVDSFLGINQIQSSDIEKLPICECNECIKGIIHQENKMIFLLNLEKIINRTKVINFLEQFWETNVQLTKKERG